MLRWRRGRTLAAGAEDRRLLAPENIHPGYYRCVPRQWTDEWLHARLSWTAFRKPRLCSWKLMGCSQGSYDLLSKREFNLRSGASGNGRQPKRAGRHCLRPASKGGHIRTVRFRSAGSSRWITCHPEQCRCLRCPNEHGDFCTTRKRPRYLSVLVAVTHERSYYRYSGPRKNAPGERSS